MLLFQLSFVGMPHESVRSCSPSLFLFLSVSPAHSVHYLSLLAAAAALLAVSVSYSFSVQKRTRTCVGRCSRRSLRLRSRSVCTFCDCKNQQAAQQAVEAEAAERQEN